MLQAVNKIRKKFQMKTKKRQKEIIENVRHKVVLHKIYGLKESVIPEGLKNERKHFVFLLGEGYNQI